MEFADPGNSGGAKVDGDRYDFDQSLSVTTGMKVGDPRDGFRYNFKVTIATEPDIYPSVVVFTPSVKVSLFKKVNFKSVLF